MYKYQKVLLGLIFSTLFFHRSWSQTDLTGEFAITAGVGVSLVGTLFDIVTSVDGVDGKSKPVLNGMVEYNVYEQFHIGLGISHQGFSIDFDENNGNYRDDIRCINIGARGLFDIVQDENFTAYMGVRFSYTNWSASTTNQVAGYDPLDTFDLGSFGIQPLLGLTYYTNSPVGINAEIGWGVYYAAIGAKLRF